jgi:hypothetical protein
VGLRMGIERGTCRCTVQYLNGTPCRRLVSALTPPLQWVCDLGFDAVVRVSGPSPLAPPSRTLSLPVSGVTVHMQRRSFLSLFLPTSAL